MLKKIEAITVAVSVLYLGGVFYALGGFYLNDGFARLQVAALEAENRAKQQLQPTTQSPLLSFLAVRSIASLMQQDKNGAAVASAEPSTGNIAVQGSSPYFPEGYSPWNYMQPGAFFPHIPGYYGY